MNALVSSARVGVRQSASQAQKVQQFFSRPSPSGGLVANGNIATPQPGSAYILDNFRCTATGVVVRRGKQRHATLDGPVRSFFSYKSGNLERLFASTDDAITDITTVLNAYTFGIGDVDDYVIGVEDDYIIGVRSTDGLPAWPVSGGEWITTQIQSSDGQNYLVGVNGVDPSFVYDGQEFWPQIAGGASRLNFDAETAPFASGETVTGVTSGATATILRVSSDGSAGYLVLGAITGGPFHNDEDLTDGEGGSATANGADAILPLTNMTFASGGALTTADLDYVWLYKNRLFFIQKGSMDAWYLPVGQIAGELKKFSLGGQLKLGGNLVLGATWSRDTGSGLNAMCAFFSSEGEVAIYQGDNPAEVSSWSIVGVYRIGKLLGKRSITDAGGDLALATDVGLIPLSRALDTDFAILSARAISESIVDLWNEEVSLRPGGWSVVLWSRKQMLAVALPTINDQPPKWIVINAQTGKASTYSNWDANCLHVFQDRLYFGDNEGGVFLAETSGQDDDAPYSATCLFAFDQMGQGGYKNTTMLRAVWRGPYPVTEQISNRTDYDMTMPASPPVQSVSGGSIWGDPTAVWGDPNTRWSSPGVEKRVFQQWRVAYGGGEVHAPLVQVTSGSAAPLDAELVRVDAVYTGGEPVV